MYTNNSCTLYLSKNNYSPIVISKCFVTERSIFAASKLGLHYNESAFCMFSGNETLGFSEGKDFMIIGTNTSIAIDTTDEKHRAQTMDNIKNAGGQTIMMADYKDYGNAEMRHWELSCK